MNKTNPRFNNRTLNRAYLLKHYDDLNRWISYYFQKKYILDLHPKSVLEIGVGSGVLEYVLKSSGIKYKSLDIEKKLKPDYVGDVRKLPVKDNSFDVVCAFQILEHIPFEDFETALAEIYRVSKKYAVISVPYSTFYFGTIIQFSYLSLFRNIYKTLRIKPNMPISIGARLPTFFLNEHAMTNYHYWEMGRKSTSKTRVKKEIIKSGF
jgi:ubiquinone/menaquinone biosynthesis C-methylase UbiE